MREHVCTFDANWLKRVVLVVRLEFLNSTDGTLAAKNFAENNMFAVQMSSGNGGDKELTAVGI
jgi:hypothetical protein